MPKGPQGQKCKADVIGNAILIAKIATGEVEDTTADPSRELQREGVTPEQRKEAAKLAAEARWRRSKD